MPPIIGHVLGLDARTECLLMQGVEEPAVRHEKQRAVGMPLQPFSEHASGARDSLVPLFRVGRQVFDQALMRLEAKLQELKTQFGLADEDLNLDLGPIGRLI